MFGFGMAVPIAAQGAPPRGENRLLDSWQLVSATWGGDVAAIDEFGSQANPWGGSDAYLILAQGAGSAWSVKSHTTQVYPYSTICLSGHFKTFTGASANPYSSVRFVNGGTVYSQALSTNSSGVMTASTNTADGGGVIDLGGGWYRAYVALNLTARGLTATSLVARFECFGGAAALGQMFVATGFQINQGTTPTQYSPRP